MKISYKKLWVMLIEREIPRSTLRKDIWIVTLEIYVKLCERARNRSESSCGYFVIGREKNLSERSIYGCP